MRIEGYKKYIDQVKQQFPDVDEAAIGRVVRHGLVMIIAFQIRDLDIYLNHNIDNYYFYIGEVTTTSEARYAVCKRKLSRKLRMMYTLRMTPYSGYYYFGLSSAGYELYKQGLPVDKVLLCKVEEEALTYTSTRYLLRVERKEDYWVTVETNYIGGELVREIPSKTKLEHEQTEDEEHV